MKNDRPFFKLAMADPVTPFYMYDTIDFTRNIGQNTHKFKQITGEFSKIVDFFETFKTTLSEVLPRISWIPSKPLEDLKALNIPELAKYLETNLIEDIIFKS